MTRICFLFLLSCLYLSPVLGQNFIQIYHEGTNGKSPDFGAVCEAGDGYLLGGKVNWLGSSDAVILRVDPRGDTVWMRSMGGPQLEDIVSLDQTADGGFWVLARSSSYTVGGYSTLLIRTDSLGNEQWNILQVYGDFGFFLPGVDFMGRRQNKPNREAYLNLQAGAETVYYFSNPYFGGIFAAFNVSAYQPNAFSPNLSGSIGYIFPQEWNKRRLRIGLNWYNGRSWSNQFYNRKEKFAAFFVEADL